MAMTPAEKLIHDGQHWFLDWVNAQTPAEADAARAAIQGILDENVHLHDYDDGTDVDGIPATLAHLSDIVKKTQNVTIYHNRSIGQIVAGLDQIVVGLDHLAYRPTAHMVPHDCVDVFEVNPGATKVTKVNICFVKT